MSTSLTPRALLQRLHSLDHDQALACPCAYAYICLQFPICYTQLAKPVLSFLCSCMSKMYLAALIWYLGFHHATCSHATVCSFLLILTLSWIHYWSCCRTLQYWQVGPLTHWMMGASLSAQSCTRLMSWWTNFWGTWAKMFHQMLLVFFKCLETEASAHKSLQHAWLQTREQYVIVSMPAPLGHTAHFSSPEDAEMYGAMRAQLVLGSRCCTNSCQDFSAINGKSGFKQISWLYCSLFIRFVKHAACQGKKHLEPAFGLFMHADCIFKVYVFSYRQDRKHLEPILVSIFDEYTLPDRH